MIEVEVKINGMFGRDFIAISQLVKLKDGANPKHALAALYDSGAITKEVYKSVKGFRLPVYLVHNDVKWEGKPKDIILKKGDTLSVMQLMSGG